MGMDIYAALLGRASSGGGGGGGGDVVVVHDDGALDKTWQEINDAMASGMLVVCVSIDPDANSVVQFLLTLSFLDDGVYYLNGSSADGQEVFSITYAAESADSYPVVQTGD